MNSQKLFEMKKRLDHLNRMRMNSHLYSEYNKKYKEQKKELNKLIKKKGSKK